MTLYGDLNLVSTVCLSERRVWLVLCASHGFSGDTTTTIDTVSMSRRGRGLVCVHPCSFLDAAESF